MLIVTPSLWDAYYYYRNLDDKTEEDLLKFLRKEPSEPTEEMRKGIEFEKRIRYQCLYSYPASGDDVVDSIADIVRGGIWQKKVEKPFKDWWLKGVMDVCFLDKIFDIKKVKSYELGKYKHSIQHLVYMYCTGIEEFEYLIGTGSGTGSEFYREHYNWNAIAERVLESCLIELTSFLSDVPMFWDAYTKHWYKGSNPIDSAIHKIKNIF